MHTMKAIAHGHDGKIEVNRMGDGENVFGGHCLPSHNSLGEATRRENDILFLIQKVVNSFAT